MFYAKKRQQQTQQSASSDSAGPSPKRLRSKGDIWVHGSSAILPEICLICKRKNNFITKQGKRVKDKLAKAETANCGRLRDAAELKHDESILMHIRDKDCVAVEARYHHSCYRSYIRFLTKSQDESSVSGAKVPFEASYKVFCDTVIVKRILNNEEVIRMTSLLKIFRKIVQKEESMDASNYRSDQLKSRLLALKDAIVGGPKFPNMFKPHLQYVRYFRG
ncbi:uncharacterized protein ACNS7B_008348 isoform 1-T1 [Menidia menidia]